MTIDIKSARQSYKRCEIESIGLIRGSANPADGLTRPQGNEALRRLMQTDMDKTPVEQWIVRDIGQSTGMDGLGVSVSTTDEGSDMVLKGAYM